MTTVDEYLNNLTGKNEKKAQSAALHLVNFSDIELFKKLADKTDFLFDFVRNNVYSLIEKAVNEKNYKNLIKFFDYYSPYYDDLFADILSRHANQDLTDEIFELLEKGNTSQKTYAAKYFSYIPDTIAIELLNKYAFSDNEYLNYNSAAALGEMQDDVSFDLALGNLASGDDFEKLKAVRYFTAYGRNFPFKEIFKALKTSKLKENISGQIPYMISLPELLQTEFKDDAFLVILYILSGLGEILPLDDLFQFELYEILNNFISADLFEPCYKGRIAVILLSALSKFSTFNDNQEYTFDETKDVRKEIFDIYSLLSRQSIGFWNMQKDYLLQELLNENDFSMTAFELIQELHIDKAEKNLLKLLDSNNEIIICNALQTLKSINKTGSIDIKAISKKINNENIKAVIDNL